MKRGGNSGRDLLAEVHEVASQLDVRFATFVGREFSQDRHHRCRLEVRKTLTSGHQLIASSSEFGSDRQIKLCQFGTLSVGVLFGRHVEDRQNRSRHASRFGRARVVSQ